MKLVAAKCPNCGASIDVDKDSESTKCDFCKSKIIVEDAIAKYKIELSGEVEIKNMPKAENFLKLADMHYNDKEYEEAYENYSKVCEFDPDNYSAILRRGLCKSLLTIYPKFDINSAINAMKNANKLLSKAEEKDRINSSVLECNYVIENLESRIENFYDNNKINSTGLMQITNHLRICLNNKNYLFSLIKDNENIEKIMIENIFKSIDGLLKKRLYYTNNGTLAKLTPSRNVKNELEGIRQNYLVRYNYITNKNNIQEEEKKEEEKKSAPQEEKKEKKTENKEEKKNSPPEKTIPAKATPPKYKVKAHFNPSDFLYIGVAFYGMFFLASLVGAGLISALLWLIAILIYIPPLVKLIVKDNNSLKKAVIILRITIPIIALIVFAYEMPSSYEATWTSNGKEVTLQKGKAELIIDNKKINGTYKSEINSEVYTITVTTENNNVYTYKYEDKDGIDSFCELKNNECIEYYAKKREDS